MDPEIQKLLGQLVITVDETRRVLRVGRNAMYDAIKRGEIETMRIGKRIVVPTAPLRRRFGLDAAA